MTSIDSIRAVVHTLRKHGLPAQYELSSSAAATRWRHQFYRLRKKSEDVSLQGLVLTIFPAHPNIIFFTEDTIGTLTIAGAEVPIETPPSTAFPDLAADLGIDLGGTDAA